MAPVADVNQVTLVERGKTVSEPYQVVGKVTVYREEGAVSKGTAEKHMRRVAAGMGADAVIGIHGGSTTPPGPPRFFFRSGLAVKWLTPGTIRRPVAVPFVIALLPVPRDAAAPGNQAKVAKILAEAIAAPLETRGYYLLPPKNSERVTSLAEARALGDSELEQVGGEDAHLLMEIGVGKTEEMNTYVLGAAASAGIHVTLMDKRTRNPLFNESGIGTRNQLFKPLDIFAPNEKRMFAAAAGVRVALQSLQPIHEELAQ